MLQRDEKAAVSSFLGHFTVHEKFTKTGSRVKVTDFGEPSRPKPRFSVDESAAEYGNRSSSS